MQEVVEEEDVAAMPDLGKENADRLRVATAAVTTSQGQKKKRKSDLLADDEEEEGYDENDGENGEGRRREGTAQSKSRFINTSQSKTEGEQAKDREELKKQKYNEKSKRRDEEEEDIEWISIPVVVTHASVDDASIDKRQQKSQHSQQGSAAETTGRAAGKPLVSDLSFARATATRLEVEEREREREQEMRRRRLEREAQTRSSSSSSSYGGGGIEREWSMTG